MKVALFFIGIIISSVFATKLQAQGTAFVYQGQLVANGLPVSGSYDFVFSLNDSSNAGNYIGMSVTNEDVEVTNGLFTTKIDFGQVFDGTARWLETSVRTNGSPTFTTLSPRQLLTPTPYAITASNALTITGPLPNGSLGGSYLNQVSLNNPANDFSGSFIGDGVGLTNLPFAKTFFSTNGFFTFTQNPDGSTNVTFIFTNGTPAEVGAQPASGSLTILAANNGASLTNLPFAKTFFSTNGFFTFTQNADGSTNVTFVFTNGTPAEVGAQPASGSLTVLAANNGAALTNLPFAKTFFSTNGYYTFAKNLDGSTNVTFVFTNGTPAEVGAQPASGSLTVLAANNGAALTNLPFAKTFFSTNGFFTFTQNADGSTNVTFIFTNGTPAEVGAQPASGSLTLLAANNGTSLTNLPFAKTFTSTNGYYTFTKNLDGSTNVTFVFTNGTPAEVGAEPASGSLTVLAANNGAALTNLPFAKTFFSTNGFFTFAQNPDGSTNVTFVFTNGTPAEVGAQPASGSLTVLAANNGAALTNLPFAKTFFSTNGFFTFAQNPDGSTNVTFVFTNGTPAEVGAQPASGSLTLLAANNAAALTNLPFAKTFSSTNGYFAFDENSDGSTNVTFVFTNGTPAEVGAQPASGNLTLLAANNGATLTNLPFAKTFSSTNGYYTFTANPDGSTNVTFVFTNGTPGEVGAQPANNNLSLLAAGNGSGLTNLPYAETFSSVSGYFSFSQNPDGSTNVTFVFTNGTPGEVGAQPTNGNLTLLSGNNGSALTNDLRSLAAYVNSNYVVSASELAAMQTTNIVYYVDTSASNILFTFPLPPTSANISFSIVNFGTNSIALTNQPGSMFEIANGYSSLCTNAATIGGYFDKVTVWQNFNATNWVQLANHRTTQEIRDIAANYVGMTNGVGNHLTINGIISGNGTGLTNLNASQLVNGIVADGLLSSNVALLNGTNNFSGAVIITNGNSEFSGIFNGNLVGNATTATSAANLSGPLQATQIVGTIQQTLLPQGVLTNNYSLPVLLTGGLQVQGNITNAGSEVITNNLTAGGVASFFSSVSTDEFTLSPRYPWMLSFPVPTLRPSQNNTVMGFDLMPNGTPAPFLTDGITWLDVCAEDVLNNPNGVVATARMSIKTNAAYFGSEGYSVPTPEVWLGLNDAPYLILHTNGNWDGTNNINGIGYFQMNNSNGGTNALAQVSANSTSAHTYIRAYSPTYSFDNSNFVNGSSLSASVSNLFLIASAGGAHIKFLTGGSAASTNTRVDIDGSGNLTLYTNAYIGGTVQATNGFSSLADNLAAPSLISIGQSPSIWTNSMQNNVYVFINGNGVTNVQVNGYTIFGSGNVTVPLQPGEYVTIGYTNAPIVNVKPQ